MDINKLEKSLDGVKVIYLREVNSTNVYARENKIKSDSIVIAEKQTAGKGRLSHNWESEPGKDLTFTIVKEIQIDIKKAFIMNFYVSLMLTGTLQEYGNVNLKWPNDIMFCGKKVCGILTETEAKGELIKYYIGIGINLNRDKFQESLKDKATSMKIICNNVLDREEIFVKIIKNFFKNIEMLNEPDKVLDGWKKYFYLKEKTIMFKVNDTGDEVTARVLDVDSDGGIILMSMNGEKIKHYAGEISFIY